MTSPRIVLLVLLRSIPPYRRVHVLCHQTCAVGRADGDIHASVVLRCSTGKERLHVALPTGTGDVHDELQAHFAEWRAEGLVSAVKVFEHQSDCIHTIDAASIVAQHAAGLLSEEKKTRKRIGIRNKRKRRGKEDAPGVWCQMLSSPLYASSVSSSPSSLVFLLFLGIHLACREKEEKQKKMETRRKRRRNGSGGKGKRRRRRRIKGKN